MNYEIKGAPFPVGVVNLEAGESVVCQNGAMTWMSPNMKMETKGGGIGKIFGRMLTGESLFQNIYTAEGGPGMISFGSSCPGEIFALDMQPGMTIVAQKHAFLASAQTVTFETFFQKKVGAGFFGGEGFFNTRVTGPGRVWLQTMPINQFAGSLIPYLPTK